MLVVLVIIGSMLVNYFTFFRRKEKASATDEAVFTETKFDVVAEEEDEKVYKASRLILDNYDRYPICPHCGGEIKDLLVFSNREDDTFEEDEVHILACPICRKILSTW